jgi:hypothetical protein
MYRASASWFRSGAFSAGLFFNSVLAAARRVHPDRLPGFSGRRTFSIVNQPLTES